MTENQIQEPFLKKCVKEMLCICVAVVNCAESFAVFIMFQSKTGSLKVCQSTMRAERVRETQGGATSGPFYIFEHQVFFSVQAG